MLAKFLRTVSVFDDIFIAGDCSVKYAASQPRTRMSPESVASPEITAVPETHASPETIAFPVTSASPKTFAFPKTRAVSQIAVSP